MPSAALLGALAALVFVLSAMLRQYREITVPLSVLLVALALFVHFRGKRTAG